MQATTGEAIKGRLLVVDDDEDNRNVLSRRLAREGFSVAVAESGVETLAAVEAEPFDLILLDIEMPGMSGFEALTLLRQSHPATQLPVIIATARHDRKDIILALSLGANDFVTKPLDFPVVLARVRTHVSHKLAFDRILALEEDLRRHNAELQAANARMRRGLDLASRVQQSLLPANPVCFPGVQFAWAYEPCDELGGDILNVFPLGSNHVGFYVLDVSGHGVTAALLSVTLCRMLAPVAGQASLVEQESPAGLAPRPPADVAAELNHRFPMTGEEMQYFTLFYGVIELATRRLRYVSAGQPPPLIVPAGAAARFLYDRGFAIGWVNDVAFEEHTIDFRPGDRLFLYSDGCTEAMSPSEEQFGPERLAEACAIPHAPPLQQSLAALRGQIKSFRNGAAPGDDISALAMEFGRE